MRHKMRWIVIALLALITWVALTTGKALDIARGDATQWTDGALLAGGIVACLIDVAAVLRFAWFEQLETESDDA